MKPGRLFDIHHHHIVQTDVMRETLPDLGSILQDFKMLTLQFKTAHCEKWLHFNLKFNDYI
jgi:hypothetical protein